MTQAGSSLALFYLFTIIACGCQAVPTHTRVSHRYLLHRRSEQAPEPFQACGLVYCRGLEGSHLNSCVEQNCPLLAQAQTDPDYPACVQAHCNKEEGDFYRNVCAYVRCIVGKEQTNQHAEMLLQTRGAAPYWHILKQLSEMSKQAQRRGWDDEMWPDDMETRDLPFPGPMKGAALSRSTRNIATRSSTSCTSACKGMVGSKRDDCLAAACIKSKGTMTKRWASRVCLEHCKSFTDKVESFLCGKMHCHRQ